MSIYEFFILPEAILCTGIIIISLIGLNPKIIKHSSGSIQIGKLIIKHLHVCQKYNAKQYVY